MRCYVIPNTTKDTQGNVTIHVANVLLSLGVHVYFDFEVAIFLQQCEQVLPSDVIQASQVECYQSADLLITVGGDGTILHEAVQSLCYGKPILGINLGRCGFLACCEEDEIAAKLNKVVKEKYNIDTRILLAAQIYRTKQNKTETTLVLQTQEYLPDWEAEPNPIWQGLALNDIVISKGSAQQTIDLSVYCDDILVENYRCDGVVIATPTGSTAYSLAAGGPIVDAQTMGIVVSAICPHKLRAPSMVFAPNRVLRIVIGAASRGKVFLSNDGHNGVQLHENEFVQISLSEQRVKLVSFSNAEQFKAIDRKLKYKE